MNRYHKRGKNRPVGGDPITTSSNLDVFPKWLEWYPEIFGIKCNVFGKNDEKPADFGVTLWYPKNQQAKPDPPCYTQLFFAPNAVRHLRALPLSGCATGMK